MPVFGNVNSWIFHGKRLIGGLAQSIVNKLAYWLGCVVENAAYPNKIGDQSRTIFPGETRAFDGTQYAYVADEGVLDIAQATDHFCLSGHFKANISGVIEAIIGKNGVGYFLEGRYGFYKASDNSVHFYGEPSGGTVDIATSIDGDTDTDRHLFLAHVDLSNSKIYVYVDGTIQNAGGSSFTGSFSAMGNAYKFIIGANNTSGGSGFNSLATTEAHDIRIYHKDVTDADSLAKLQKGEQLGDEVAWWWLEGDDTVEDFDASGNGYHLTAQNYDATSVVEDNSVYSLRNKYGWNANDVLPDMSTAVNGIPTHDVDGVALVNAGQVKYNAIARNRNCFLGDGVAYWQSDSAFSFNDGEEIEFKIVTGALSGSKALIGELGVSNNLIAINSSSIVCRLATQNLDHTYIFSTDTEYTIKLVRTGDSVEFFIDGVSDGSESGISIGNITTLRQVAARNSGIIFDGKIIYVAITGHNWQFCEGSGTTVYDVSGNGNHLTGVNVDETNWGVIDTPDVDRLAEYGVTVVEYDGETRLVPYLDTKQSQYSSVAPILNASETATEHSQTGKNVIPGTFFSLPQVKELIDADDDDEFFDAVTTVPEIVAWSDILSTNFNEQTWYINAIDRKDFMIIDADETLTADEITAVKKYCKIT